MLGQVLNAHQQWLCERFRELGRPVARQIGIPDTAEAIQSSLREALSRSDLVIMTGGLGPTSDDVTRDRVAELLGRKLKEEGEVVRHIERFFVQRGKPMPSSTRVQAMVPEKATILMNQHGTAPGLVLELNPNPFKPGQSRSWLVLLPGPRRELRPMFDRQVVPFLEQQAFFTMDYSHRLLRCIGPGESLVQERIAEPLAHLVQQGLEIGYCARNGEVDVRLTATGKRGKTLVDEALAIARSLLGAALFAEGKEGLEEVMVRLLKERELSLGLAESCTGGLMAHRITNVPGASEVLWGSLTTYSNAAKERLLGVQRKTLDTHGAVSEQTAEEMLEGLLQKYPIQAGIAVTGIAGPSGGTTAKTVGTVFIAAGLQDKRKTLHRLNRYDRETFKQITSQQALDLLRRLILDLPMET